MELAELAAGLPFAASFAMAGGISVLREGRRRTALNEAMHELRRPLQAIALAAPASGDRAEAFESSLRMAAAAVDRLDREINGRSGPERIDTMPLREIVERTVARWRLRAYRENRPLSFKWQGADPGPPGDAVELTQALDNLISNGFEHGSGEVAVEAVRVGSVIRLSVVNQRRTHSVGRRREAQGLWIRIRGCRSHGHGLRIVRRVAARNGGSFRFRQRGERCEAVFDLPLPGGSR